MTTAQDVFRSRFEIRGQLGEGGMGEVHLAYDAFLQREVAIKLTKLALLKDPEVGDRMQKMWLNETRLAGKLRHPQGLDMRVLPPLAAGEGGGGLLREIL